MDRVQYANVYVWLLLSNLSIYSSYIESECANT